MVLGITGGVGSGKSTIMALLREHFQAKTLLADEIGHKAMCPGEQPYKQIIAQFGESVCLPSGELDRNAIANIIYADDDKREQMNQIIHPYVLQTIRKQLQDWKETPLVAVETAIMFESGCNRLCDKVWYVRADSEIRIQRLMDSRGYTRQKAEMIMATQMSDEEGMQKCDEVIDNSDSLEKVLKQMQELLGTE